MENSEMLANDLLPGAKAAAEYIGETPRAVYNMAEKGLLPVIRKGRKLYFRKSELDAAFSSEAA
jgi:excisionase family DNA binding protein